MRKLRAAIAGKKKIPAYIVFGDAALRDMARRRPSTLEGFLEVKGVGEKKCQQYGEVVLAAIKDYCLANSLEMDIGVNPERVSARLPLNKSKMPSNLSKARQLAFKLFEQKLSIKKVAKSINRAESTTTQYLVEYIKQQKIDSPYPWIDERTFGLIVEAVKQIGSDRMKPIFDFLKGKANYTQIRISIACFRNIRPR